MTEAEEVFYGNYGLIDVCDDCGKDTPITNRHDGKNYLTWEGKWLYCKKCMADSFNENKIAQMTY